MKQPPLPDSEYARAVANEAIVTFVQDLETYRNAVDKLLNMGEDKLVRAIDFYYQVIFDKVVDSLINAYESGAIDNVLCGLKKTMDQHRFPTKSVDTME